MKAAFRSILQFVGRPWVALAIVVCATLLFHQKSSQSPVWLAPYLSGAANWSPGEPWLVDPSCVDELKRLSHDDRWTHRFERTMEPEKLVEFKSMDIGWLWVVWAARKLMPFCGDLCSVSVLTILLHHALAAMVWSRLTSPVAKGAFILLYLANPLVIHVVSMPYYYAWQAIASLASVAIFFIARNAERAWHWPLVALLLLCVAIRPNVVTIAFPAVIASAFILRSKGACVAVAVFVMGVAMIPKINKPFWHTVYSGLGAYPNRHGLYLSDNSPSEAYSRVTGEAPYSAGVGGSFHDPDFRRRYSEKLKQLTLEVVADDPMLPVRNATLNSLIAFAWVYKPYMPFWVYLAQAAAGLVLLILLTRMWRVTWLPIVSFGLVVGPIVIYHPPIAAYVVGGYPFLGLALAFALAKSVGAADEQR